MPLCSVSTFLALSLVLLASPVAAVTWLGTESAPEITDDAGDVMYDERYVGPRDHDYLDVLAAWTEYDDRSDQLIFIVKVGDLRALEHPDPDWEARCTFGGDTIRDGTRVGSLSVYTQVMRAGALESFVELQDSAESGPPTRIPHEFTPQFDAPGYLRFGIARTAFLEFGTALANIGLRCSELYYPGRAVAPASASLSFNQDDTDGGLSVDLAALAPTRSEDEPPGPAETSAETPASPTAKKVTSVTATVTAAAMLLAAARIVKRR